MADFDVIIVGGGPSGSATAIRCAQAGLRVILIERMPFPREHPGETLHPGVEPLLEMLGVAEALRAAAFLRHEGNWVEWGGAGRVESFGRDDNGPWRGFQAWRADFDAILLRQAQAVGIEVLQPCRALHPLLDGNRIVGVATSEGALRASFVVDAAGSTHWLARLLQTPMAYCSPRLIVRYGWVEGDCPTRDEVPAIVADSTGWTWTARVRPQLYQWTRMLLNRQKIAVNWLPPEYQGLSPWGKTRGADVSWRLVNACAGPGYFLVGDAATVLDPVSSHGVLKAMMSGMLTGHLIEKIIYQGVHESKAIQAYSSWIYRCFAHDVGRLKALYTVFSRPKNAI